MKRTGTILALFLILLACVSCKKTVEIYMAYDPLNGYEEPSFDSEVVHHWTNYGGEWEILEKDSTGQFGRIRLGKYFFRHEDQWMPLDEMVYAGSTDPDERLETFVVIPNEIHPYHHPKVDKNDTDIFAFFKGDTVQGTARVEGWVHIRKFRYNRTEYSSNIYGWVPEKELTKIDTMTIGELEEIAYQKAWDKEEKNMAKTYLPGMRKIHQTYADVCEWISGFALIFWLVFLIPARRRGEDIVNKTLLWLFVLLTTTWWFCTKPSWYFALQIPLMVYVGMYPMLYFRPLAFLYRFLYPLASLGGCGYYLYYMTNGWGRTVVLIVLAVLMVAMTFTIVKLVTKDICPHCGYFTAFHARKTELVDTSTSTRTDRYKTKVGESTRIRGNVGVTTEYYTSDTRDVRTTTDFFVDTCICAKCGKKFKYHHSETNEMIR
ncbi:MAG: hypothetical protein K5920_02300 [Bacteroidales bacterium]|nr:hypothetical protein [Bacteroidales bacterium]